MRKLKKLLRKIAKSDLEFTVPKLPNVQPSMLMKPAPIPEPVVEDIDDNGEDNGNVDQDQTAPEEQ